MKDNNEYFQNWYLKLSKGDRRLGEDRAKQDAKFIKKVLGLPAKAKILDLCCGEGRHSLLLADTYDVTGLDSNKEALRRFKQQIKLKKAPVRLVESDMRDIPFQNEFDAVINMFTSFGYFSDNRQNIKVLLEIYKSLKDNGKLLLDIRNKESSIKINPGRYWSEFEGGYLLQENKYNKHKDQEEVWLRIVDKKGGVKKTGFFVKAYDLQKIKEMLEKVGFEVLQVFGDTKMTKYTKESDRIIVLAQKR